MKRLLVLFVVWGLVCQVARGEVRVVEDARPIARIVVDTSESKGNGPAILQDAADWLEASVQQSTGARLQRAEKAGSDPAIIIARADAWPQLSRQAGLQDRGYDAYCVLPQANQLYILGNSESAARHGVAHVLRDWGFRWFAPSPRWHIIPKHRDLAFKTTVVAAPALKERRIWYAYGMSGSDLAPLQENYQRWVVGNRLSSASLMQTGHSYGNIIGRNPEAFAKHPEYYALLPDGKRDSTRAVNARKFCFSNPGLIELVAQDRQRLLDELRRGNPAAFMVSMDPSDGEGTCHCDDCAALGSTTDRVLHLANQVARHLRKTDPDAWVGLYAYSSHRLPPQIEVEPNVYVQVAMGFNRTQYTLPELIERWSKKVGSIGLREYYGVEAWDWGLPGRMRGSRVDYHRKWIPYYAQRKLNAINGETNANWGGQTLGLYVAAQLMWDPKADTERLSDEFFTLGFGKAAAPMRQFYARMDAAPPLRSATLLPLLDDLKAAWKLSDDDRVRQRLVDLMAYVVYIAEFRTFDLVRSRRATRDDAYYEALRPLMEYAWRIRHRDMVHYYALARRLCNGLPVQDQRLEYYLFNKQQPPVWQTGEAYTDEQIRAAFDETLLRLQADEDPTVAYSRRLDRVQPPGDDAGPSGIVARPEMAVARFRNRLTGYLVPATPRKVRFAVAPLARRVELTVHKARGGILFEKEFRPPADDKEQDAAPQEVEFELPTTGTFRVEMTGNFRLHVPEETPLVYEASVGQPAWISYSGPHYFYVPRGTRELIVDANPRLSLQVPGIAKRLDVHPADRKSEKQYIVVKVPEGADGKVWHTTNMTRGQIALLNVPPLLSFHRNTILVPREVSESDSLSTGP